MKPREKATFTLSDTEWRILQGLESGPESVPEFALDLGYRSRSGHFKKALERPATPRTTADAYEAEGEGEPGGVSRFMGRCLS